MHECRILICKSLDESRLSSLERADLRIDTIDVLNVEFTASAKAVLDAIQRSDRYWIITSSNAAQALLQILKNEKINENQLIYHVGHSTRTILEQLGFQNFVGARNSENLVQQIDLTDQNNFIYFCGNHSLDTIPDFFQEKEDRLDLIEIYQTSEIFPILEHQNYDAVFYLSPLGAKSISRNNKWAYSTLAVAIGSTTAKAMSQLGFNRIIESHRPTIESMLESFYEIKNHDFSSKAS